MALISKSEFARQRGCAPSYVTKLIARGVLKPTPDGRLDATASHAAVEASRQRIPSRQTVAPVAQDHDADRNGRVASFVLVQGYLQELPDEWAKKFAGVTKEKAAKLLRRLMIDIAKSTSSVDYLRGGLEVELIEQAEVAETDKLARG